MKDLLHQIRNLILIYLSLNLRIIIYKIGDYVLVSYDQKIYPGTVLSFDNYGEYEIETMEKTINANWKWPEKPDQIWYKKEKMFRCPLIQEACL